MRKLDIANFSNIHHFRYRSFLCLPQTQDLQSALSLINYSLNLNKGLMKLVIISSILTLLLFNSKLVSSEAEIEDENEFSYDEGCENGPENWWKIHKEWAACGNGSIQSPINILDGCVRWTPELEPTIRSYRPAPAVLKNRSHSITLKWEHEAGSRWINGLSYHLKQIHWHSPSEHTFNGHRYPLEMQMVHERNSEENSIDVAVVSVLYKFGTQDRFLAKMEKYLRRAREWENGEEKVGMVNPWQIKREGMSYYRYMGSLTTPPCTEGVVWTILEKVGTVSSEQVRLLREAVGYKSNARPIQAINQRIISLYHPTAGFGDQTLFKAN